MKKIATLKGKLVAALAIGAVVSGVLVATTAAYSQTATNSVTMNAGTIDLSALEGGTATIDLGANLYPGMAPITKTIVVGNSTGTLPLNYTMATSGGSGGLGAVLDVDVKVGATVVGTKTKLNALNIAARPINAKSTESLTLTFNWPSGTPAVDNALQGRADTATFTFTGVVKPSAPSN